MTDKSNISDKSYGTAVILAGIFGILGIHHFYLGRFLMGIFDLSLSITFFVLLYIAHKPLLGFLFLGIDVIHTVIVTFQLLVGTYKDGEGKIIAYPGQFK